MLDDGLHEMRVRAKMVNAVIRQRQQQTVIILEFVIMRFNSAFLSVWRVPRNICAGIDH